MPARMLFVLYMCRAGTSQKRDRVGSTGYHFFVEAQSSTPREARECEQGFIDKTYIWQGLSWRLSACGADVIATGSQLLLQIDSNNTLCNYSK